VRSNGICWFRSAFGQWHAQEVFEVGSGSAIVLCAALGLTFPPALRATQWRGAEHCHSYGYNRRAAQENRQDADYCSRRELKSHCDADLDGRGGTRFCASHSQARRLLGLIAQDRPSSERSAGCAFFPPPVVSCRCRPVCEIDSGSFLRSVVIRIPDIVVSVTPPFSRERSRRFR
jgi:hypothetical protein